MYKRQDVLDLIKSRRSIRKYDGRSVEEEKLTRVLEAGRLAPSARNMQEWKFVVVQMCIRDRNYTERE